MLAFKPVQTDKLSINDLLPPKISGFEVAQIL